CLSLPKQVIDECAQHDNKSTFLMLLDPRNANEVSADLLPAHDKPAAHGKQHITSLGHDSLPIRAELVDPEYIPDTVNTDSGIPTQNAWKNLFPSITLLACFLHMFIGIHNRSKKNLQISFKMLLLNFVIIMRVHFGLFFSQRVHEWCINTKAPPIILEKIKKIRGNLAQFTVAYNFPGSHHTSNMIDCLMQRMDRHLFSTQYFHGTFDSATLSIRTWALIQNFAPFNPQTIKKPVLLGGRLKA
ncbi:hypothetical protein, partial [Desulfocicer niacini]